MQYIVNCEAASINYSLRSIIFFLTAGSLSTLVIALAL